VSQAVSYHDLPYQLLLKLPARGWRSFAMRASSHAM
jgi:hypothetical protein